MLDSNTEGCLFANVLRNEVIDVICFDFMIVILHLLCTCKCGVF